MNIFLFVENIYCKLKVITFSSETTPKILTFSLFPEDNNDVLLLINV